MASLFLVFPFLLLASATDLELEVNDGGHFQFPSGLHAEEVRLVFSLEGWTRPGCFPRAGQHVNYRERTD